MSLSLRREFRLGAINILRYKIFGDFDQFYDSKLLARLVFFVIFIKPTTSLSFLSENNLPLRSYSIKYLALIVFFSHHHHLSWIKKNRIQTKTWQC